MLTSPVADRWYPAKLAFIVIVLALMITVGVIAALGRLWIGFGVLVAMSVFQTVYIVAVVRAHRKANRGNG
jgi:hypothetical protein